MTFDVENGSASKLEGKYAATFICWALGSGCLFAWNSMVTSEDYFVQLFAKYHPTRVLSLSYQLTAFATMAILTSKEAIINTRLRNLSGYTILFVCSLLIPVLDLATSGKGGIGVFIGLCANGGALGIADALAQGGVVGELCFMNPELMQSYLAGIAASGTVTSVLRFVTKAAFENTKDGLRKGAMLFFALSAAFELLCLVLYAYVFPKLPIVKYYRSKAASEGSATVEADLAAGGIHYTEKVEVERLSKKQLLLQSMDYLADAFLIFLLTLSIFPGFLSEDTGSHSLGSWYVLVLIAAYNVSDIIGRYIPLIERLRMTSRRGLMFAVLSRFLLIPAFYFSARYGDQGWLIMLTSILGLTTGYFIVCVLMAAPKGYKGPEQNALGNLLVLWVLGGVVLGIALDWLWLIGKGW